jgi:pseudouridylate synthase
VLDGSIRVGLSSDELERLAATSDVPKLNLSNLAAALLARGAGSTTVAATMLAAHHAGIGVFATGGIGGVHRGASETDDVSSDLTALARYPVAVVCSGAKAILDLPRTVERLETLGVPVYGFRCDDFPAFWRRSSGLRLDQRFDDMHGLAEAIRAHHALGTGTGIVVASPVPEADELDEGTYQRALEGALAAVASERIRGRAVTPFMLEFMHRVTGGRVVVANIALLKCNARVAGELAVALANT